MVATRVGKGWERERGGQSGWKEESVCKEERGKTIVGMGGWMRKRC